MYYSGHDQPTQISYGILTWAYETEECANQLWNSDMGVRNRRMRKSTMEF